MVDTSRTFFAVQRGSGKAVLGKHLLCLTGKCRDSVLCHPPANVPWCCSCHHWGGGGLIRSQLAALLMRESHRSLHGQESGMSCWVGSELEALLPPRVHGSGDSRHLSKGIGKGSLCSSPAIYMVTLSPVGRRIAVGVEVRAVGGGDTSGGAGCSDVAFASTLSLLCHGNIMEKPFYFCHFRLSQRVPYRPRVKLLPRRRTRRRTDM